MSSPNSLLLLPEAPPIPRESTFWMHSGNSLYMANGLQPLGDEKIQVEGGEEDVSVLAKIKYGRGKKDTELWITKKPLDPEAEEEDESWVIHHIEYVGDLASSKARRVVEANKAFSLRRENEGVITFVPADGRHRGWASLRVGNLGANITVSEADHPILRSWYQESDTKRRIRRWKQIGALAMTFLAFKATTMPGGIYDQIMDPYKKGGAYVTQRFGSLQEAIDEIPKNGQMRDGIHFSRKEAVAIIRKGEGTYYAAVSRVAGLLDALDNHQYDKINQGAKQYEKAMEGIVKGPMKKEAVANYLKRLETSTTTKESLAVTDEFLSYYGAHAYASKDLTPQQVNSDKFKSSLKFAGKQIVEALGPMPDPIVRASIGEGEGLSRSEDGPGIVFAFGAHRDSNSVYGSQEAYTETWNNRITFLGTGILNLKLFRMAEYDFKKMLRHEMSHALFGEEILKDSRPGYGSLLTRALNIGSHIIGQPEFTTDYATANSEEETAEVGVRVLAGKITSPDHVGDFESRSNLAQIEELIHLEKRWPHITAYLITTLNPELIGRKVQTATSNS